MIDSRPMSLFGSELHVCKKCGRQITDKESIRRGLGDRCLDQELGQALEQINRLMNGGPFDMPKAKRCAKEYINLVG